MKPFFLKIIALLFIVFYLPFHHLKAQQKTFDFGLKLQGTAGSSQYVPFWLQSNQHGIVDINSPGGNAIFHFKKNLMNHESGFDYGFGATLVSRYSDNTTVFFNQLYGTLSYGVLQLKGGRFYEQLGDVDSSLSMGSLAISSNATPLPKIKFGIFKYTDVPLTHGYVEFKGEIAHGWFEYDREIHSPWLHQKSAYLRFGGDFNFRPYVGLTDQATWGGTGDHEGNLPDSFNDFLRVVFARHGTGNPQNGEVVYRLGDHRGVWDLGFNLTLAGINFKAYRQQIYNDGDGLMFKSPDGLTGLSIHLPAKKQHYITGLLWEFLYTKDQDGSIPPNNGRDGPGGRDNYYNNYLYRTGWTYEGRTIGNPLFLNAYDPQLQVVSNSKLNTENPFGIVNNRIVAQHLGVEGELSKNLQYKLLATWSRNYGLYYDKDLYEENGLKTDFYNTPEEWSFLAKFSYLPYPSLRLNMSLAGDTGQLYNNRIGILFGIELLGTSSF